MTGKHPAHRGTVQLSCLCLSLARELVTPPLPCRIFPMAPRNLSPGNGQGTVAAHSTVGFEYTRAYISNVIPGDLAVPERPWGRAERALDLSRQSCLISGTQFLICGNYVCFV